VLVREKPENTEESEKKERKNYDAQIEARNL